MSNVLEVRVDHIDTDTIRVVDSQGQTVDYDVLSDLSVHDYNANDELREQHVKYRKYANIYNRLSYYLEEEEIKLVTISSQINLDIRNQYQATNGKPPTKDVVEAEIQTKQKYIDQLRIVNHLKYQKTQLQYILKAFEQRKDMLVQYTAHLRKDIEHGTRKWGQ
ncbi:hypothetical protein KQUDLBSD_CDS0132 [Staphylococcus phage PG-2021_40]|nr:hypothetical protein [Mammaliicoccus phage vB_MscM-PMS3]WBF82207.1 hypothetical protein [Mammaliicoccus virus vB_MscM-PMS2]